MRQNFYPYENAIVERVNGVLKQEFNIDNMHLDLPIIWKVVTEVIFNNKRPHLFNQILTPDQMHLQKKLKCKTYKHKNNSKLLPTTVYYGNFLNPISLFRTSQV